MTASVNRLFFGLKNNPFLKNPLHIFEKLLNCSISCFCLIDCIMNSVYASLLISTCFLLVLLIFNDTSLVEKVLRGQNETNLF